MNSARSVNLNLVAWAWFLWLLALAAMAGVFVVPDVGLGLRGVFLAYAVSAVIAGTGLWRRKRWMAVAFAVWAVLALLNGLIFDVMFNHGPTLAGGIFLLVSGVALWLAYRYVRAHSGVGA